MVMTINHNQMLLAEQHEHYKLYCHICRKGCSCELELQRDMRAHEEPKTTADRQTYTSRSKPSRHRTKHIYKKDSKAFPSKKSFFKQGIGAGDEKDDPNGFSAPSSPPSCYKSMEADDGIIIIPASPIPRKMFNRKPCKVAFTSHEAQGGHHMRHKKVKSYFSTPLEVESLATENAAMEDKKNNIDNKNNQIQFSSKNMALSIPLLAQWPKRKLKARVCSSCKRSQPLPKKKMVHVCSVCKRQFALG